MLTQTLIHAAILAYFSLSSGHDIDFGWHAGKKAAAKAEEKVVLDDRPFCEKCAVQPDVQSPMPNKIASFHWDLEKATSCNALPVTGRRPVYCGFLTVEFDKRVADIFPNLKLETKPVSQLLGENRTSAADVLSFVEMDAHAVCRDTTVLMACPVRRSKSFVFRRSTTTSIAPRRIPRDRLNYPEFGMATKAKLGLNGMHCLTNGDVIYDCSALMFHRDPTTYCFDPARFYWCHEEFSPAWNAYEPQDPLFLSGMGRCNNVLNASDNMP